MENDMFVINPGPSLLHYDPFDSAESHVIRELIGKLAGGGGGGGGENSPPAGIIDPAFAERAARNSFFAAGSRSFNGRAVAAAANLPRVSSSPSLKESAVSQDESTVSEHRIAAETANPRKRKASSKSKPKELPVSKTVEIDEKNNSNAKRNKHSEGNGSNSGDEKQAKAGPKPPEPPKDYIHVRARRGQATDSHSLAERVRREKISERMKLLQDLVPGCNKVTGKALMLDEIINYVQSLQRQVEFLSMKLSSVNTRLDGNDTLMSKDVFQPNNSLPHPITFPLDSSAQSIFGHQPHQNQDNNNISSGPMNHCPIDTLDMQFPQLNGFSDFVSQYPIFGEDDLQSIVQMGFGQNPSREASLQPQSIHGQNQVFHMKIEL